VWYIGADMPMGAGVLVPPVGRGVVKVEGISEVKIVADGERINFLLITASRAWMKPVYVS
jgi:hypothetical protein